MAPVEVFLLPSFQEAVNKLITFEDGVFVVERRFNVELTDTLFSAKDNLILLESQKPLEFSTQQFNAHSVVVTLKDAVLKRDIHKRLRTSYIASFTAQQVHTDVQLRVVLGEQAQDWSFTQEEKNQFVFRAGATKAAPVIPAKTPELTAPVTPVITTAEPVELPSPSVMEEENPSATQPKQTTPAAPVTQPTQTPLATAVPVATVSVASAPQAPAPVKDTPQQVPAEADEFEEMVLTQQPVTPEPEPEPVTPVPAAPATSATPVIKAEPHPLAIKAHKKMRIVVDPGHGGKDPGAVRSKYREKDWNLAVGKELARLLEKNGFEVKITRDTDVFIALSQRSKIANEFKADLFVSVHTNSTKNSQANGFQVYFRSEKATDRESAATAALENEAMQYEEVHYNFVDALLQSMAKNEYINESSKVAGYVKNAVNKQPGIDIVVSQKNAIRQANFYVLKGVQCPAILVEMGYISSPKDRAKLSQSTVQKKMAQGIYNGIVNYAKQEVRK